MSTLERAIEIAHEAHRGQRDKAGNDYIDHPMRVMAMGKTMEEKIVGVLHDVVEDAAEWSFERLEQEGFEPEIIEALRCVTKRSEDEPYDKFIVRVKTIFSFGKITGISALNVAEIVLPERSCADNPIERKSSASSFNPSDIPSLRKT